MSKLRVEVGFAGLLWLLLSPGLVTAQPSNPPAFWERAEKPPMGWNSWDSFGTTVTEAAVKANADYMATNLATYGWQYITVDIQWYEPNGAGYNYPSNPQSNIDQYGRLWPVTNKHPSATNGLGFKPLADYIHGKGLKFGIHLMRGIPRRAWTQNKPVLGTPYFARDIANTNSICSWNPDMYGVDTSKTGAQAYYNSVFQLLAQWEVDFVKVDDLSRPYHTNEIEAIRVAIENCGRPMVLSTSPGETPLANGEHVYQHANMWRVSDDFWDVWSTLYDQFQRFRDWTPYRGNGFWPDGDMLPLGNIRTMQADDWTRFTEDEQFTLMTTWCIVRSPLIMGGHLPNNDAFTLSLLTNPEVLEVNQNSANNHQLFRTNDAIAWVADVPGSAAKFLALINASATAGFDQAAALFDSGVVSRSTPGRSVEVTADITGATKLCLVVTDAGDYFGWDHANWGYARLVRADGSSNQLPNLNWVSATSGWNPPPKENVSIEGNPITINGVSIPYGIGTHAISVIEYDLPPGFVQFRALAGLDDEILSSVPSASTNATVRFLVYTNSPTGRRIEVSLRSLGINEPVVVRDLWQRQDMGVFTNTFSDSFPAHGSGLYKVTPLSALPNPAAPQGATATARTNQIAIQWMPVPGATGYNVKRATLAGGPYEVIAADISETNHLDTGLGNGSYFYVVTSLNGGNEGPASVQTRAYLPFAWNTQDIGDVQRLGTTFLTEGTFAVSGSGSDTSSTNDTFRFAYTHLAGDATLIARVVHQADTHASAKAGLMIRESLNANARHCMALLYPSSGCALQYRSSIGGSRSITNVAGTARPYWLKLVRQGNTFRGYSSPDGVVWTQVGNTTNISMSSAVHAGLAVTSHASTLVGTAFFDNVSMHNGVAPPQQPRLQAWLNSESQLLLSFTTQTSHEYQVQSATNLAQSGWEVIAGQLVGDGSSRLMTNTLDAAPSQRFYRVVVNAAP